jgi:hypothetical protein
MKYVQRSEKCGCDKETMQHIVFYFKILASKAQKTRHDNAAKQIRQKILLKNNLPRISVP